MHRFTLSTYTKSCIESQFSAQGLNELNDTASAGIGGLASMRRASLKKSDQLFENIELREYDKEADQKRQNIKSFRIPKKGAAMEEERGDYKPVQRVAYRIGNLSNADISDFFVYRIVYRIEPPISNVFDKLKEG